MADSTKLVDSETPQFAAEIYRCYLVCAARIVKANDGSITAYDGDRIMAVFIGDTKNTNAAKTALQINAAVIDIINPPISNQYPQSTYRLSHVIGIDTMPFVLLFVARIGVRNDNDLVWVGRAANYAAKLSSINEGNTVFIIARHSRNQNSR
jgi:class 3 adenylate cyclase